MTQKISAAQAASMVYGIPGEIYVLDGPPFTPYRWNGIALEPLSPLTAAQAAGLVALLGSAPPSYTAALLSSNLSLMTQWRGALAPSGCSIDPATIDYMHESRVLVGSHPAGLFGINGAAPTVFARFDRTKQVWIPLTAALQCVNGATGALVAAVHINCVLQVDPQTFLVVTSADQTFNGVIYRVTCTDANWSSAASVTSTLVCVPGADDWTQPGVTSGETVVLQGSRALSNYSISIIPPGFPNAGTVYFAEYNAVSGSGTGSSTVATALSGTVAASAVSANLNVVWAGTTGVFACSFVSAGGQWNTRRVTVTNGATAIAWSTPLSITTTATIYIHNQGRIRVLSSPNGGKAGSWSVIMTQNGDANLPPYARHWHLCQTNPYTGDLFISTGDASNPAINQFSITDAATVCIDTSKAFNLPSNADWSVIRSAPPSCVKGIITGFLARTCCILFQPDGYLYYSSDNDPGISITQFCGISRATWTLGNPTVVSRRGYETGFYSGFIGAQDDSGNMLFSAFANVRPTISDVYSPYMPIFGGQADGNSWSIIGGYGVIANSAAAVPFSFVWDGVSRRFYFNGQSGAGRLTATNYKTAVFGVSSTPNTRDTFEIVLPVNFVNPVTGVDDVDTAGAGIYGQRGFSRNYAFRTIQWALTGNRSTHGGATQVVSPADYLIEDSAFAGNTQVSGGLTYGVDKMNWNAAWNAMATVGGQPMAMHWLDLRQVPGFVRVCQNSTAGTGFKAWAIINPAAMALGIIGGRIDAVEVDSSATPTKGVNSTSTIVVDYYSASAPVQGSALTIESVAIDRVTRTMGSANQSSRTMTLAYAGHGTVTIKRCNIRGINLPVTMGPNAGVQPVLIMRDTSISDCAVGWNDGSTTLSLVKYDIDHCYFNVKSSLASFQVATALYPDQFSVRNTAIVVEGTTGANLSHFQSAGWTASYSTVAQALTVTGHQSIVDVGGITKIIGANVNVAGAAATFAAGNVGRCIAVIGGAAGGAYGLMFIRAVDATGTNATCDILRPLSTAAISASQWAVVTAMKPAFKNCVFNAPFNKGGFNPFPEPDQDQANVYAIPAGVTASEGQSTVGYAAPDILRGNTVDPLYALPGREVVGTRVQLPVLTL